MPAATPPPTLVLDIGGSDLKALALDAAGRVVRARVSTPTRYPCSPSGIVAQLEALASPLGPVVRVSVGFPGVVRHGRVMTAPHFVSPDGPGGPPDAELRAGNLLWELPA